MYGQVEIMTFNLTWVGKIEDEDYFKERAASTFRPILNNSTPALRILDHPDYKELMFLQYWNNLGETEDVRALLRCFVQLCHEFDVEGTSDCTCASEGDLIRHICTWDSREHKPRIELLHLDYLLSLKAGQQKELMEYASKKWGKNVPPES